MSTQTPYRPRPENAVLPAIACEPRTRRRVGPLPHGPGFWFVAAAFLIAMAFSAAPTPLYVLYQHRDHFSAFVVSVVFAAYAVGVIISLFLAGHISDWLGRRRVLLPALLLEVLAALLFLLWPTLTGLIAARLVTGLGIGMITATATAHLGELHAVARPGAHRARADLTSTAANLGGLGLGPLVSGLLAQFVADPLRTPYVVFIALLLLSAVGVALVPETVQLGDERPAYRPQRVSLPPEDRARFLPSAVAAFAAFAILGLFSSLAPGFVAVTMHHPSRALAGLVALTAFGTAAAAQMLLGRATVRHQLVVGLTSTSAGLVTVSAAAWLPSLPLFLAGGAAAGAGAGILLKGAISTVADLAAPAARGETLAGLFLCGYVGLTLPVLGIGIATLYVSSQIALLGFALAVLTLITAVGRRLLA
ncbi:MFS transporter [Kitasatospora sp. GP82]|uniref:MFS transporter n=1 Tax=Kitasatospora sp. GP82 TaxID=3035089 RepID=UPI002475E29E|nr:MFS transporter [Kitasatospora sp. GP82]MDH6127446.1 MFS family permease [Kitasatospora sp. GP82]